MTARSKVTLVEAQRIRSYLVGVVLATPSGMAAQSNEAVDVLLALGLIDTDAALRALEGDGS